MTVHIIPTASDVTFANYTQRTVLDSQQYVLLFQFNERENKWYLNISDQDNDPIAESIKLVANYSLLRLITDPRRPPGRLFAVDTTSKKDSDGNKLIATDPGLDGLVARVSLVYLDAAEVGA